jgi:hypothetical protein
VMHTLIGQQVSSENLFHDQDVFEDVAHRSSSGVTGHLDHQVPRVVAGPSALPVIVQFAGLRPTPVANDRVLLFRIPTVTEILGPTGRTAKVPARWLEMA